MFISNHAFLIVEKTTHQINPNDPSNRLGMVLGMQRSTIFFDLITFFWEFQTGMFVSNGVFLWNASGLVPQVSGLPYSGIIVSKQSQNSWRVLNELSTSPANIAEKLATPTAGGKEVPSLWSVRAQANKKNFGTKTIQNNNKKKHKWSIMPKHIQRYPKNIISCLNITFFHKIHLLASATNCGSCGWRFMVFLFSMSTKATTKPKQ